MTHPSAASFFSTYGADTIHPRQAWRGLLEVYRAAEDLSSDALASRLVDSLATRFPSARDVQRLKRDSLSGKLLPRIPQHAILAALAKREDSAGFDEETLQLKTTAEAFWRDDPQAAIKLIEDLITARLNPLGERILERMFDAVAPEALANLGRVHRGILPMVVSRSPNLAKTAALWTVPVDQQREILDALAHLGNEAVTEAIPAVMAGGSAEVARDLGRILGKRTAGALLRAIDSRPDLLAGGLAGGWRGPLLDDPRAVVEWLQRGNHRGRGWRSRCRCSNPVRGRFGPCRFQFGCPSAQLTLISRAMTPSVWRLSSLRSD